MSELEHKNEVLKSILRKARLSHPEIFDDFANGGKPKVVKKELTYQAF